MLEPDSNYRAFRRSAQYRIVVRSKALEKRSTRGKQLTVRPYRSKNHLPNQQRRRRRRTSSMPYVMSDRDLRRPTFTCKIEKKQLCYLCLLNTRCNYSKHTVFGLYNVYSNHAMSRLQWTRIWKKMHLWFWHTCDLETRSRPSNLVWIAWPQARL